MNEDDLLNILKHYFKFKPTTRWTTLIVEGLPTEYQTKRVGKLRGNTLYFTIGETSHGVAVGLADWIRQRIAREGLPVLEIESTAGNGRVFPGFEWVGLMPSVVEQIIQTVLDEVKFRG